MLDERKTFESAVAADAGLIVDNANNIFGTTSSGGLRSCRNGVGCGVVFKIIP